MDSQDEKPFIELGEDEVCRAVLVHIEQQPQAMDTLAEIASIATPPTNESPEVTRS